MTNKKTDFNPLAVNILRLQNYSDYFELTEIVLFEWFMIKASSFRKSGEEFYYSNRRISEETRIKDDRVATIIKRFIQEGIISREVKGIPRTSYYIVRKNQVIALLPKIYQFPENSELLPENSKLLAYFSKLLPDNREHKGTYKEPTEETYKGSLGKEKNGDAQNKFALSVPSLSEEVLNDGVDSEALAKAEAEREEKEKKLAAKKEKEEDRNLSRAEPIVELLNRLYKDRIKMSNDKSSSGGRGKTPTGLAFTRESKLKLYALSKVAAREDIQYSFIAFIDEFIKGDGDYEIQKPMPYFLAQRANGDFDTYLTYLERFQRDYSYPVK